MRLARLDLLRYRAVHRCVHRAAVGKTRYSHRVRSQRSGEDDFPDCHRDMLFGIPERSPYDFLHSYEAMRVGAVLETAATASSFGGARPAGI